MSVSSDKNCLHNVPDSARTAKENLRRQLLEKRRSLDSLSKQAWDYIICKNIRHCLQKYPVTSLGLYFAIQNEPDLMSLYTTLSRENWLLSLPIVTNKKGALQFARWNPGDPVRKDSFGVPVPEKEDFIQLPEILLIPCLGFTTRRYRLGYGGGYYDRTLAHQPRPKTIGISYSCLVADFPPDQYDIPLDYIVTEKAII